MKIIRFLYDNWFDAATLSATTEDPDFPVANIQHSWFMRHWRSTSKTAQIIAWKFAGVKSVKAFILKYHNFTGGHIHIRAGTDVGCGNLDVELPITYDPIKYMWDDAQSWEYWQVDLTSATSGDSYFRTGRIYSGSWWSPTNNFDNIYRKRLIDPSAKVYSSGGQMSADLRTKVKEIGYQFSLVIHPDEETFESIFWSYVGKTVPYWICQDYDKKDTTTMYVENVEDWEIEHEFMDTYWKIAIVVRECE